jgi:hypothetical protein
VLFQRKGHETKETSALQTLGVSTATMAATTVLVSMQPSAFILSEKVSAPELDVKIAPISQPNYTFLRLSNNLILPDILDRHDLRNVSPANENSRVYDLGQGTLRRNQVGVYLH